MSLFGRLEQRSAQSAHPRDPVLAEWWGGGPRSHAGVSVTTERATGLMPVWAAVRLIAETIASLPLVLMKKVGEDLERATSHPLYSVLHDEPNEWQTSLEWREMKQAHVLLRGVAYSVIVETRGGYPEQLIPIHPDRVAARNEPIAPGGPRVRYYYYQPIDGPARVYWPHELFVVRGISMADMMRSVDPIANAREALGIAIAAEEHGARFLANNIQPGGVFEHPARLKDEAFKRLKADLEGKQAGTAHAGKTLILEEGMKWHQIGMTNKDAQYLELRKFSVSDVARMFKVPPHMIADLDRATFSNIEHQAIEFVRYTMLPWFVRWEQRISKSLLGTTERKTIYPKFIVDGLLRGDTASRYAAYAIGRQWGWLSANDVRRLEDMNPLPGEQGDIYVVPLNMVPAEQAANPPEPTEPEPAPAPADDEEDEEDRLAELRRRIEVAHVRFFLDAAQRILGKEIKAAMRAIGQTRAQKSVAPLDKWLDSYDGNHETLVARALLPAFQATADSLAALAPGQAAPVDCDALARQAARRHVAKQRADARKAFTGTCEERAAALESLVQGWESRAAQLAGAEVEAISKLIPAVSQAA